MQPLKMLFIHLLSIIAISLSANSYADEQPLAKLMSASGFIEIPLEKNAFGHYIARAKINGEDASFLIDSGATTSIIDTSFIMQQQIQTEDSDIRAVGVGGQQGFMKQAHLQEASIGEHDMSKTEIKVLDMSHINNVYANNDVSPINGIIGADYLRAHQTIVDFDSQTLWVKAAQ